MDLFLWAVVVMAAIFSFVLLLLAWALAVAAGRADEQESRILREYDDFEKSGNHSVSL